MGYPKRHTLHFKNSGNLMRVLEERKSRQEKRRKQILREQINYRYRWSRER